MRKHRDQLSALARKYKPAPDLYAQVALRAYEDLGGPRACTAAGLLRNHEFQQLAELRFNPSDYNSFEEAQRAWASTELLRKFPGMPGLSPKFREVATMKKVAEAEQACAEANRRVRDFMHGGVVSPRVARVLSRARRKIHDMLPNYSVEKHLSACRWGPGSDALNKRPYTAPYHKFSSKLAFTRNARAFVALLTESNSLWGRWLANPWSVEGPFSPLETLVRGNALLTVPKTALVDRPICVEPGANVYLQLGLGQMLRSALQRVGIDLSSQERNKWYALVGSEDSAWATIDLSSASDTVSRVLVQYLFSESSKTWVWFRVMDSLRSYWTKYPDGRWLLNHKFSSMGNGFTFELETIVFWAIVSSLCEQEGGECAAVYGDDIIVDRESYPAVVEVLEFCGFSVNRRKSFDSTYFRESCGMNAWNGYELKSYRLESLENIADVYSFHNGLIRIGARSAANYLLRQIPAKLRFFGPEGAGDVVLHGRSYEHWDCRPHGLQDQWFFWSLRMKALVWRPMKCRSSAYEPAILHSLSTMVPLTDHAVYIGGRWGSEGSVTLSKGEWTVGEILVSRENAGLPAGVNLFN